MQEKRTDSKMTSIEQTARQAIHANSQEFTQANEKDKYSKEYEELTANCEFNEMILQNLMQGFMFVSSELSVIKWNS